MKKIIAVCGLILLANCTPAQDTLTLFEAHRQAMETHPLAADRQLYETSAALSLKNLNASWYPDLDVNGQFTWQSEVVEIGSAIPLPGAEFPEMPHDSYRLTVDINQTVYDGGITRAGKALEQSRLAVNKQKLEVDLNQLKEQVNQTYFYILVLQKQEELLRLKGSELEEKKQVVVSGVRNGTLLSSSVDIFDAEILRLEQQIAELAAGLKAARKILVELTGAENLSGYQFVLPALDMPGNEQPERPEHTLFDLQISSLDASKQMTRTQGMPKLFVFGQLGYGNPALNFFRDEFRSYYLVGAGLKWEIWDWNRNNRERQILGVQQDLIRSKKKQFDQGLRIKLSEEMGEIQKYREAVRLDRQIVSLRERVSETSASQLRNGTITPADYMTELNAETQARMTLSLHEIQLVQAQIKYLTTKGDL